MYEVQSAIWQGFAIAARELGSVFDWYRPAGGGAVVADGNRLGTLPASLAVDARYSTFQPPGKPFWRALVDGAEVKVGDYLVSGPDLGDVGTFFIGQMAPLLPIMAVKCNAVLSVLRAAADGSTGGNPDSVGALGRWEPTAATDTGVLTGWPAALISGGRGETPPDKLPEDSRTGGFTALLPELAGVELQSGDRVADTDGNAFTVSAAERNGGFWRLSLIQVEV